MVVDVSKGDPKVPTNEVCRDHECANEYLVVKEHMFILIHYSMICIIHGSWICIIFQNQFSRMAFGGIMMEL